MPSAVFIYANAICIVTGYIDLCRWFWSDKTEWDRGRSSSDESSDHDRRWGTGAETASATRAALCQRD